MRLLQLCNVGNIVGGTAACAWSVTRALPELEHILWFRGTPTAETRRVFADCQIEQGSCLSEKQLHKLAPELILLHNTPREGVFWGAARPTVHSLVLHYGHSRSCLAAGSHRQLVCSRYLQQLNPEMAAEVLYQGVPRAGGEQTGDVRVFQQELTVGRICTPAARKWNASMISLYRELAAAFPNIQWEFVGCPEKLQSSLSACVQGQARFYPASWQARQFLKRWHVLLYSQPDVPETFGRVCAEAMRCGCVPVVDAAGGFQEQVTSEAGYLCADAAGFVQALQELQEIGHWWKCSQTATAWANEQFSHQAFRRRLLAAFLQTAL